MPKKRGPRGPYKKEKLTADRREYDRNYYAENREKILAHKRAKHALLMDRNRKQGEVTA